MIEFIANNLREDSHGFWSHSNYFAMTLISKAEVLSLLGIVEELSRQVGLRDPDGLSVPDRFYRQRAIELEKLLGSLEHENHTLAAILRERIDEAMKAHDESTS